MFFRLSLSGPPGARSSTRSPHSPCGKNEGTRDTTDRLKAFVSLWCCLLLGRDLAHLLLGIYPQPAKQQYCLIKARFGSGRKSWHWTTAFCPCTEYRKDMDSGSHQLRPFWFGDLKAIQEPGILPMLSGWYIHAPATRPLVLRNRSVPKVPIAKLLSLQPESD